MKWWGHCVETSKCSYKMAMGLKPVAHGILTIANIGTYAPNVWM